MQASSFDPKHPRLLLNLLKERQIDPRNLIDFFKDSIDVARSCNNLMRDSLGATVPYLEKELAMSQVELFIIVLQGELWADE